MGYHNKKLIASSFGNAMFLLITLFELVSASLYFQYNKVALTPTSSGPVFPSSSPSTISTFLLTHWGRVTHICVSDLTSIGSDNGLSPGRRQAIIRTNAGILLIGPLGTIFSEFLVEVLIFSFKKMRLKVSYAKRRPFCLSLNELKARPMSDCMVDMRPANHAKQRPIHKMTDGR